MLHDDERARPWIKLFFTSLSILANLVGENDSRDLSSTHTHFSALLLFRADICAESELHGWANYVGRTDADSNGAYNMPSLIISQNMAEY